MQPQQPTPEQNTPPPPVESVPGAPAPLTPAEIVAQAAQAPILPPRPASKKLLLPIILMIWPTVALILCFALYTIINLAMAATTSSNEADLFGDGGSNPIRSIINVCLFLVGASAVGIGPISFIVGLVLLVMRIKK